MVFSINLASSSPACRRAHHPSIYGGELALATTAPYVSTSMDIIHRAQGLLGKLFVVQGKDGAL